MKVVANPILRKYQVAEPRAYDAVALPGKEGDEGATARQKLSAVERPTAAATAEPAPKKRAVWIVHGMGQQVPFETVDGLAEGLMRVAQPMPGRDGFEPRVRTVQIGEQTVQRVELDVFENGSCVELHLYEAYWAPVTEGEVKLAEVIGFLWSASSRGLLNVFKPFHRAMFGEFVQVTIRLRAALEIGAALLTLVALIVANAVIVAAGAAAYGFAGARSASENFWNLATNWEALSAVASWVSAVALAFGLILYLAELCHPAQAAKRVASLAPKRNFRLSALVEKWSKYVISGAVWAAFVFTLLAIIGGAARLGFLAIHSSSNTMPRDFSAELQVYSTLVVAAVGAVALIALAARGVLRSAGRTMWSAMPYLPFFLLSVALFLIAAFEPLAIKLPWVPFSAVHNAVPAWVGRPFWVWPFLLAVSWMVRTLMVQYVGDVAAYVTAQTLDRFNKIRQRIKEIALTSARNVYLAQQDGEFLYDRIAVVGHSLGSVIAYDTLNALLNAEKLASGELEIASRTCLLETFGSPLDKIAFFFSYQGKDMFHIREQMAESVQPLITDYGAFRTFPWINVYSLNDIVSGPVELYDLPLEGQSAGMQEFIRARGVQHLRDPDAIVPLVAHVSYWKNTMVWEKLLAAITG